MKRRPSPARLPSANPAQIHAARVLTEMLRSKYRIPESNCVTHAQVSVNPDNMLIGYHTDWAGNFPFLEVGLNDNYTAPPPSIYAFGFDYDPSFVHATGVRLWQGLALAEDQMRTQAAAQGLPLSPIPVHSSERNTRKSWQRSRPRATPRRNVMRHNDKVNNSAWAWMSAPAASAWRNGWARSFNSKRNSMPSSPFRSRR